MKPISLAAALALLLAGAAAPALAGSATLKGDAAKAFITKNFPNADIPGPVSGKFTDTVNGRKRSGQAQCSWPAMGAAGEGVVATCKLTY